MERSIAERSDDASLEVFKAQSKSVNSQAKKTVNAKKFQGKCHKCGKKGHMQKDCWAKVDKESTVEEKKASKTKKEETSLVASSVFKIDEEKRIENRIIADSGASIHLTGNRLVFVATRANYTDNFKCCKRQNSTGYSYRRH